MAGRDLMVTGKDKLPAKRKAPGLPDRPRPQAAWDDPGTSAVVRAWTARGPVILGILALIVLIGGFGTWSFTSRIASAIVASGSIEVELNRQVVQHPDGGVVKQILVKEGDVVDAGQVLIRLDSDRLRSELNIVESQLWELAARRGRLEAERDDAETILFSSELLAVAEQNPEVAAIVDGARKLFAQRRDTLQASVAQLEKRKGQIRSQIEGLDAQLSAQDTQTRLISEELANQQVLREKGLAQAQTILSLEREKARLEGQAGEIIASKAQYEGRITEIDIQILQIQQQRREDAITALSDQEGKELELAERRRALTEQLDRLDIRAPVAGAIHALQVFAERAVIQPAQALLYIVPQDRPLIIGAQVDPIHVDEIRVGQEVVVRFPAFSRRTTPELNGRVTTISPDAFHDDKTGRSFYRVRIELSPGEVEKLPAGDTLIPGMPAEAYLTTGERSPFAYLVKPFTDYFTHAFREQ